MSISKISNLRLKNENNILSITGFYIFEAKLDLMKPRDETSMAQRAPLMINSTPGRIDARVCTHIYACTHIDSSNNLVLEHCDMIRNPQYHHALGNGASTRKALSTRQHFYRHCPL